MMSYFFFEQDTIDCRSTIFFLTQLIILLGKYHIHVKKWAQTKPKCEHFIKALCQFSLVN